MTKYLGGQGNSVGGAIVEGGRFDWANGKFPLMTEPTEAYHGLRFFETFGNFALTVRNKAIGLRDMGPALSPFNAFLILQGIETLPLRMDRHVANADKVAAWLADQPARQPGSPTPACRRTAPRCWRSTARAAWARCSPSASRAATRWACGWSTTASCSATSPTSATPAR